VVNSPCEVEVTSENFSPLLMSPQMSPEEPPSLCNTNTGKGAAVTLLSPGIRWGERGQSPKYHVRGAAFHPGNLVFPGGIVLPDGTHAPRERRAISVWGASWAPGPDERPFLPGPGVLLRTQPHTPGLRPPLHGSPEPLGRRMCFQLTRAKKPNPQTSVTLI